jgi:hypothetical protein
MSSSGFASVSKFQVIVDCNIWSGDSTDSSLLATPLQISVEDNTKQYFQRLYACSPLTVIGKRQVACIFRACVKRGQDEVTSHNFEVLLYLHPDLHQAATAGRISSSRKQGMWDIVAIVFGGNAKSKSKSKLHGTRIPY